ncbi:hypothetical protein D3C75_942560 [compost metagenome]
MAGIFTQRSGGKGLQAFRHFQKAVHPDGNVKTGRVSGMGGLHLGFGFDNPDRKILVLLAGGGDRGIPEPALQPQIAAGILHIHKTQKLHILDNGQAGNSGVGRGNCTLDILLAAFRVADDTDRHHYRPFAGLRLGV